MTPFSIRKYEYFKPPLSGDLPGPSKVEALRALSQGKETGRTDQEETGGEAEGAIGGKYNNEGLDRY